MTDNLLFFDFISNSRYLFDGTYIGTKQVEHSKRRYWPRSMIYDQGKLYFLFGLNIDSADYPQ